MEYAEALDYINHIRDRKWILGLSRIRELLRRLGDPQKSLRFVHVAGTNGKGSTCAMLASVLMAAGYRTGILPSPYLEEFRERIQVNGVMISEEAICRITEKVKAEADAMGDEPTHFEVVTALAMMYFKEAGCDIVVLEVGLGGEFDATNVIDAPDVAVLTNIGFDHTEYLGNTLAEIARTKAGIIKEGSPAVVYPNVPEVMDVLTEVCAERGCRLITADFGRISSHDEDLSGQTVRWDAAAGEEQLPEFRLPLAGDHQLCNAAVALTVIEALREMGWAIDGKAVRRGMESVSWPARFELLGTEPVFILDGGHNLQCAEAASAAVRKYLPGQKVTLLTGMLADKDCRAVMETMLPVAERCYTVTPSSNRAMPAEELAGIIRSLDGEAEVFEKTEDAINRCLDEEGPVLAFGSLYMAGEVRRLYREISLQRKKKQLRKAAIRARNALSEEEKTAFSAEICRRIAATQAYKDADVIFAYKWTKGEVRLEELERLAAADGKRLVYPVCTDDHGMVAVEPGEAEGAWNVDGAYGIKEPVPEKGTVTDPSDIDLAVCPCSSFDDDCNRLGMGGGYYDRFLPACVNAVKIAVAFEAQRSERLPMDAFDRPMDAICTEQRLLTRE